MAKKRAKRALADILRSCRKIELEAAIRSDDVDAEARTVAVSFSSETPVRDYGWGPPVVLLHEPRSAHFARFAEMGSILLNHDVDQIVGRPESVELDAKARKGRAVIRFDEDPESERIWQKVKNGSLRGISVRYQPRNARELKERESWKSPGGKSFRGPLYVVDNWEPREISLTPLPADQAVGVGRQGLEDQEMPQWLLDLLKKRGLIEEDASDDEIRSAVEKYLEDDQDAEGVPATPPADPPKTPARATPTAPPAAPDDDAETRDAEATRCRELAHVAQLGGMDSELAGWIANGTTVEAARAAALKKRAAQNVPTPIVSFDVDERDKVRSAVLGVLMRRAAVDSPLDPEAVKRQFGEIPKAAEDMPSNMGLLDLARFHAMRSGARGAERWDREDLVRYICGVRSPPGGTSSDLPYLLEAVVTKSLSAAFMEYPATYQGWTQVLEVPDFKSAKRVKLSEAADFKLNPPGMPIEESILDDISESYSVATYARKFGITRQAIINDDLDGIMRLPALFGIAAQRGINKLVYATFLGAPTMAEDSEALFSASHTSGSNLTTSGGAFSITTLSAGMALMAKQKGFGEDSAPLNIFPSIVLCPIAISTTVRQIIEGQVNANTAANAILPWMRNLSVVSDPLLDANDANAWYLAARPGVGGVDGMAVVFLRGRRTPTTEREETGDVLGLQWRSYIDYGAKALEHRSFYKNDGGS